MEQKLIKKSLLILMVVFLIILFMFVAQLNCGLVANAEEEKLTFSTSIVEDSSLINLNTTNISQFKKTLVIFI